MAAGAAYTRRVDTFARVRVVAIPSDEEGLESVELESRTGARVTVFAFGESLALGDVASVELHPLDIVEDFEDVFSGNSEHESGLQRLGDDWAYRVKGQVVGLDGDTLHVDAAGFIVHLSGLTRDQRVVGAWVSVTVSRMDLTRVQ